jgi:hypothetical protein
MTIVIGIIKLTLGVQMSYIKNWYVRNQDAITWFLIGWLSFALALNVAEGDWIMAAITALFIWANYKFIKIRLQ